MAYPPLSVVNNNDEVIGSAPMEEVLADGLIYRIVLIAVIDEQGRLLLQKRNQDVKFFPGLWDISAAGHVDAGEDYVQTARRELYEELGLKNVDLLHLETYRTDIEYQGRVLHRFAGLFQVKTSSKTEFRIELDELSEVKWFSPEEIQELYQSSPESIVSDVVKNLNKYLGHEDN